MNPEHKQLIAEIHEVLDKYGFSGIVLNAKVNLSYTEGVVSMEPSDTLISPNYGTLAVFECNFLGIVPNPNPAHLREGRKA
jgi:hypothetical protein